MPEDKTNLILQELVRRANEEARRLRSLEQRMEAVENRTSALETSGIARQKRANEKFAEIDAQLNSISEDVAKIKNLLEKISRQTGKFARKSDVQEIERMFDLLSPIKQKYISHEAE